MSDPNKILFKDFSNPGVSLKDVDGKKGIVTGYFANFDSIDSDGDIIKSGSFNRTIKGMGPGSDKPRIKHLINHNPEQPVGVLLSLKEDQQGLYYESKIGTHSLGRDFILMAESGLITEHSIGFKLMKYNQIKPWDEWDGEGDAAREITEVKLYEGSSLTAWGANENTPLTGIKSDNIQQLINKARSIEKFCRESKATDETIESLLLYNKELLQTISLQTTQGSPDPAENGSHSESEVVIKVPQAATIDCPSCLRFTYNTTEEKGYCKCHRCNKIFVPGGPALSI